MRCVHCNQHVVGNDPITVQGVGVAHRECHKKKLEEARIFMGINLSDLPYDDLATLSDLLCAEMDIRDTA